MTRVHFVGFASIVCVGLAGARYAETLHPLEAIRTAILEARTGGGPNTRVVREGDDLQAALDAARPGDTLRVQAGATFAGNFVLRVSGTREQPITLQPDGDLPDRRIGPGDADRMFSLAARDPFHPALKWAARTRYWVIRGAHVVPNRAAPSRTYVEMGSIDAASLADLPVGNTIDQCYLEADPAIGGRRGIQIAASDVRVTRSTIAGFWFRGQDSQAVWIFAGTNIVIDDNQLEGSGENIMSGGADPKAQELAPTKLVIRRNTLFKPDYYKQQRGSVKNSLELKSAVGALIEQNDIGPNWKDAQAGVIVAITPRNAEGRSPWTSVRDVIFRDNRVHDGTAGINILGQSDRTDRPTQIIEGLEIRNNVFVRVPVGLMMGWGGSRYTIAHNTWTGVKWQLLKLYGGTQRTITSLVFENNVAGGGRYGITGDGAPGLGEAALKSYAPDCKWASNVIAQSGSVKWPAGTTNIAADDFANQVDAETGAIAPGSDIARVRTTDGSPVGADLARVPARP